MSREAMQIKEAPADYRVKAEAQEVPLGYKRTEAGVIPEDWNICLIGSLLRRNTRITYGVVQPGKNDPTGVLFIRGGDVLDGKIDEPNLRRIPRAISMQYQRTILQGGELVISLVGFPGECAIVPTRLVGANIARQVALVRFAEDKDVSPEFVCHYLQSNPGRRLLLKEAFGSAQQVINLRDVNRLELPIPRSLSEQRTIAEALSDVDGLLAALDKLIAKKRAIKQAAMQQLLTGKTRLPGFSGEWETKRLVDVADLKSGATPNTQVTSYWNGTIPWCTPTDITGAQGKYLSATERNITEEGLASCAVSLLPIGSLLLCSRATIGEVKIATTEICTNQGFKSLVCREGISNEFLYYLVLTLKPQMIERAIGSTFLEIGKRDLGSIQIKMPKEDEQTAIATVLSDMDAEIAALEARRDKTRALKQGMMQQLLTGRVRLVRPEHDEAAAVC